MRNLRMKVLAIGILLVIPLAMTPFGYCGEGGPKDTEKLTGPSIDAMLVLRHFPAGTTGCGSDPAGYIAGTLMGICNGVEFAIEGTCANGYVLAGDLTTWDEASLTNATTQLRFPAPAACTPKPNTELIVVTVKQFYKSYPNALDQATASVVLMWVGPR